MKNKIKLFALTIVLAIGAFGDVICLDTYDQLDNHTGKSDVFFVRDAANEINGGQGGDPSVGKGYAVYLWDARTSGWKMIGKQELLGKSVDISSFLTIDLYTKDQDNMRAKIDSFEKTYAETSTIITNVTALLGQLTNAFDIATMQKLSDDNARMQAALAMVTNTTISTNSSFSELKSAISNICASASAALGGPAEFKFKEEVVTPAKVEETETPVVTE